MLNDAPPCVLTIDDEPMVRKTIADFLEDMGYDVLEAENGRVGLKLFREKSPDAILVDLRMPEVDGLDVLASVTAESDEVPVIVVSGTGVLHDAIEALRRGAWDYVTKPIEDMAILEHALKKSLERARLLKENKQHRDHLKQEVRSRTFELKQAVIQLQEEVAVRKKAEEELRRTEEKYRRIFENAQEGIFQSTFDGAFISLNPALANIIGYDSPEALMADTGGTLKEFYIKENQRETFRAILDEHGKLANFESEIRRKDGSTIWISENAHIVTDDNGAPLYLEGMAIDINSRKLTEEKLKASLKEKDILLKEVHHRVKNNLQIISSLLSLQSHHVDDPRILELLTETRTRIASMALVHKELYQTGDFSNVDFQQYIEKLVFKLVQIYGKDKDIQTKLDLQELNVPIDMAIPCGLLINELVTNALKHAFKDRAAGALSISMRRVNADVRLIVADDGQGLPADLNPATSETLGMQLISGLSDQLKGKLEISRDNGARFAITFPV